VGYFWLQATLAGLSGIEPHEVLQALYAKQRWPRPGVSPEGVRVLLILARTNAGRPLVVAVRRMPGRTLDWWIAGARDMTSTELAAFEEWEADR